MSGFEMTEDTLSECPAALGLDLGCPTVCG